MGKHNRFTEKDVLTAIKGSGGIVSAIAQRLGCEWATADKSVQKWKSTLAAYADEKETILDLAESTIVKDIKGGSDQSAKWYLSKKGKDRGYGDQIDIDQKIDVVYKVIPAKPPVEDADD